MDIEWITIPVIMGISFLFGLYLNALSKIDNKWIPALLGTFGGILGAIAYAIKVPWMPADDIFTAIFIGIGSGLASVGAHQIYKQLTKKEEK